MATHRDPPLRLHRLRLAGELAEIRAAQLRFTEEETRQLVAAAGTALPDEVAGTLHQRTEGGRPGCGSRCSRWPGTLIPSVSGITRSPKPSG